MCVVISPEHITKVFVYIRNGDSLLSSFFPYTHAYGIHATTTLYTLRKPNSFLRNTRLPECAILIQMSSVDTEDDEGRRKKKLLKQTCIYTYDTRYEKRIRRGFTTRKLGTLLYAHLFEYICTSILRCRAERILSILSSTTSCLPLFAFYSVRRILCTLMKSIHSFKENKGTVWLPKSRTGGKSVTSWHHR